jgi:hypothetical protein
MIPAWRVDGLPPEESSDGPGRRTPLYSDTQAQAGVAFWSRTRPLISQL